MEDIRAYKNLRYLPAARVLYRIVRDSLVWYRRRNTYLSGDPFADL